jgi:tetratricopeptide (TPR) repeat protein
MAEESEGLVSGGTDAQTAGASADPAAVALALGGASREDADAFLKKQGRFIDLQTEHLHEQRAVQLSRLRLGRFSDQVKAALQVMIGLVGVAIVIGLVIAAWNASQADGMVVDAFSVPPQFAQDGITGEVVAGDLTHRIGAIRNIAVRDSLASSKNVHEDSAEDIKVEIPETGVSLGQLWRYLRLWLGHERHLGGNLRLLGQGKIALTVALDSEPASTVSGADLDTVEQQAAEQMFAGVDPTNYTLYLLAQGRKAEALAAAEHAAQVAVEPVEQAGSYYLWGFMTLYATGDLPRALALQRIAVDIDPKLMPAHREMMWMYTQMGHDEEALRQAQLMRGLHEEDQPKILQNRGFAILAAQAALERDLALGAYAQAASENDCSYCSETVKNVERAEFAARAHDGTASRALAAKAAALVSVTDVAGQTSIVSDRVRYFSEVDVENWPAAAASARSYQTDIKADPSTGPQRKALRLSTDAAPLLAYALVHSGDPAGAQAMIDATPGDCYNCIRTRGLIAAAARQWGRADYWFARAVQAGPSLPFAYADWGQSLLARGDAPGAIAKFSLANRKGPQFADALEMWGEAQMAQNRSDRALAKFSEASNYAPNWGRLHLKWGEALEYAGRKDEARAQYQDASKLDLAPSEKAELTARLKA